MSDHQESTSVSTTAAGASATGAAATGASSTGFSALMAVAAATDADSSSAPAQSIRMPLVFDLCGLACNGLREDAEAKLKDMLKQSPQGEHAVRYTLVEGSGPCSQKTAEKFVQGEDGAYRVKDSGVAKRQRVGVAGLILLLRAR